MSLYISQGETMSYVSGLSCMRCKKHYALSEWPDRCPSCGGVINISYDIEKLKIALTKHELKRREPGMWKYSELLPLSNRKNAVSLGEGGTYLHTCDRLAMRLGVRTLYLKDETTNPTGAFLDRGMSVEVSIAKERGIRSLCCGSTGNLAASLVAYAARAGIKTKVFMPQKANFDTGKLYQILAYGAAIELVGNQEEVTAKTRQLGEAWPLVTASSPYFLEGIKTTGYEVCEQLAWNPPDWIVIPMGNGGHIARVWKAINELRSLGFIETDAPKLVGVQAKGCSPIVDAFRKGLEETQPCKSVDTIAIDIGIREPSCGNAALSAIRQSSGLAIAVTDRETLDAAGTLPRLEGVFAEPASATTIAAMVKLMEDGTIDASDRVVCMITGMGLKYPEITKSFVRGEATLERLLTSVEERRYTTELGKTKQCILQILSGKESYGYDIWRTLRNEYSISLRIPSIYQHLLELKNAGLVAETRSERTFEKRLRNYYSLTERGRWTLSHLQKLSHGRKNSS